MCIHSKLLRFVFVVLAACKEAIINNKRYEGSVYKNKGFVHYIRYSLYYIACEYQYDVIIDLFT